MKRAELSLFGEVQFTVDREPGLFTAEGRRLIFQIATYKGLYRVLRMLSWHLADPRPLIALNGNLRALGLSLTIMVGRYTFFVLGNRDA